MLENQNNPMLVSHRLRGFDGNDASLAGLHNALSKGITHIEVDCRVTIDGEIVIHHDAKIGNNFSTECYIAENTLAKLKSIHYTNSTDTILTLDELFEVMQPYKEVKLYLDIKENGKEEIIFNKASKRNLLNNLIAVSWLPEVLIKAHQLLPDMQLCFSFFPICNNRFSKINFMQTRFQSMWRTKKNQRLTWFFDSYNNDNHVYEKYGYDFEHFVSVPMSGKLYDILQRVNGIACVNYSLVDSDFIYALKKQNLQLCLYSLNEQNDFKFFINKYHPDIVLTDNASFLRVNTWNE